MNVNWPTLDMPILKVKFVRLSLKGYSDYLNSMNIHFFYNNCGKAYEAFNVFFSIAPWLFCVFW